jgi:hypothetical protein
VLGWFPLPASPAPFQPSWVQRSSTEISGGQISKNAALCRSATKQLSTNRLGLRGVREWLQFQDPTASGSHGTGIDVSKPNPPSDTNDSGDSG